MRHLTFKEYLQREINKPFEDYYNPEGNSERAVVSRGKFKEVLYQYKRYPSLLREFFAEYNYLGTTVRVILFTPVVVLFAPILPILIGLNSYKRAIKSYKYYYTQYMREFY